MKCLKKIKYGKRSGKRCGRINCKIHKSVDQGEELKYEELISQINDVIDEKNKIIQEYQKENEKLRKSQNKLNIPVTELCMYLRKLREMFIFLKQNGVDKKIIDTYINELGKTYTITKLQKIHNDVKEIYDNFNNVEDNNEHEKYFRFNF